MIKKLLLLGLIGAGLLSAQNDPVSPDVSAQVAAGFDGMYEVVNSANNLWTESGNLFYRFGMEEYAFFFILGVGGIVFRWGLSSLRFGHYHSGLDLGELVYFFFKSMFVLLAMELYSHPFPGTNFSLHQFPAVIALMITKTIDQQAVKQVVEQIALCVEHLQQPNPLNVLGVVTYMFVLVDMAIISLALFVINAGSFVVVGVMTLFGQMMIPFFLTKRLEHWFWGWVSTLVSFSMYRPICAAVAYVFGNVFMAFFTKTINGEYGLGLWGAEIVVLSVITVSFIYSMVKLVPLMAGAMFGGAGQAGAAIALDARQYLNAALKAA